MYDFLECRGWAAGSVGGRVGLGVRGAGGGVGAGWLGWVGCPWCWVVVSEIVLPRCVQIPCTLPTYIHTPVVQLYYDLFIFPLLSGFSLWVLSLGSFSVPYHKSY